MSAFSEAALEKKLSELSNSQQSVQTLSLWLIHHRKHSKIIVTVWYNELRKAKVSRKLTFLYLANDVIQNSKRKGPEFTKDFAPVIVDAFRHVASDGEEGCKKHLGRVLSIWQERAVYDNDLLEQLRQVLQPPFAAITALSLLGCPVPADEKQPHSMMLPPPGFTVEGDKKPKKRPYEEIKFEEDDFPCQSSPGDPPQVAELIKALQELENAASGDATVRQRISSLPLEVQDVALLDRITDKESGDRLSKMVDDACMLLADYNGRLAAEIDDRKQLTRTLMDFLRAQKEILAEKEQKLEEYKHKLAKVSQVRKELRSRMGSLPDLSLLPNVTGGHLRLPSSGDMYNAD
ncbi:regulation of nuclear pre-mRNA domain-containing protein 1A isoform X1 [Lepisosteus oculatus]|uniref:regulation of nuclear pre-mRNA domain-containing protein 1A isoform X1 n=1 Tax=Lepisosteus oculatus TaxID=7918 RepID=UPI00073FF8C4|nr:PREDICTED: regulation of nuclear pre-mRNA domain-containing protein 1A isoform X1 [Lepisosteus oculatus]